LPPKNHILQTQNKLNHDGSEPKPSVANATLKYMTTSNRITFNPQQCGGKPCVRGMRIRVTDVLALLANHLTFEQILHEMPDLELADISACIEYAIKKIDYPVLKAA
jgi:uncharacterized protein (DUF433 family)